MRCSAQFKLVVGLLLLVAMAMAGTAAFFRGYYAGSFMVLLCLVFLGYRIFLSQQTMSKLFLRMLNDVKFHDNSLHFSTKGKVGIELQLIEKMNDILMDIKQSHFTKEEQSNYYETLLNIIDSCLIVVNGDDKIYWMNQQAESQLCGYAVHSVDELKIVHEDLPQLIRSIRPGEMRALRIYKKDLAIDMAVAVTEYQRQGKRFKLVHLRNIRSLLEENEMEAWQKLVRVLTHEIMNSIAPIISLSETLSDYTENKTWAEDNVPLLRQGLQTIHRRSKGLLDFVENYRKLTRISTPVLAPVRIGELLTDIEKLCSDYPITFDIHDAEREVIMDRTQMEQVLINLIKNAYEACADQPQPKICVKTSFDDEQRLWVLTISDNGCGILPDVVDKIFVPFFTTKINGSGIGLSLCKQVVNLHGGRISVKSKVDVGTTFIVKMVGE